MSDTKKQKSKIGHSLEELEDGLILTLRDQSILEGNQINEDADVFENYEMRKINQNQHNRQIREKLKTISNAATSHLQAKNQGQKSLLPHYDDYSYKTNQIDLDQGIHSKKSHPKQKKNLPSDFQSNQQNVQTEYFESKKFKPKKQIKPKTDDLIDFLNKTAQQKEDDAPIQKSAQQIISQSFDKVRKRRKTEKEESQLEAVNQEDDLLLEKALKRSRQQKHAKILDIIKQQQNSMDEERIQPQMVQLQLNPITYQSTTFTNNPQNQKKYDIKDAAKGTTSCLYVNLPSQKSQKLQIKKQIQQLPQSFNQLSKQQLQKMKDEISFLDDKNLGLGMADTLKYLRQHNMFGKEEQFGRNNDGQADYNNPDDRVKLQYRNANGKLMKPKQAFRYLSSIFHGMGPGKKKVEKMKKKQLMELKMKEATSKSEGKFMSLLEKHQQKSGQAHMVINLGGKNKRQN